MGARDAGREAAFSGWRQTTRDRITSFEEENEDEDEDEDEDDDDEEEEDEEEEGCMG